MKRWLAALALFATAAGEPPRAWPWLDRASDATTVLLMGDTNIQKRADPASAYANVLPTLHAADVRFANLEGPFAGTSGDPNAPDIGHKESWTHSTPDQVAALSAARIDGVGVANNVTFPRAALMRSLAVLDRTGIGYTGGGPNLDAAHRPLIIEREGVRIAFLQFAATVAPYDHAATPDLPGVAEIKILTSYRPPRNIDKPGQPPIVVTTPEPASLERMRASIAAARAAAHVVIASYHWGLSDVSELVGYQREVARSAVEAGADLVFGHGPHVFQPVEIHRGKPILYSLANFVFDWPKVADTREGLLARAVIRDKRIVAVSLVPAWRDAANDVRLHDPRSGKGRELYEALLAVNGAEGAKLSLAGQEIRLEGLQ